MIDEEQEREVKQAYMKEHIMEQEYDMGQFASFICSKKLGGDDVDNWTLKELKNLVNEFTAD